MIDIADFLADFIQPLRRGEALDFGMLQVTREGIQVGERHLSWSNLDGIDVSYGDSAPPVVMIFQKRQRSHAEPDIWAMLSTTQVSNLPLLLLMIHEIGIENLMIST